MEIKYLGGLGVQVLGKKESVLINPEQKRLESKVFASRIVAFTSKKYDFLGVEGERVVLRGPGEYEIGGIEISGYNGGEGETVYVMMVEGLRVGVIGNLTEELSEKRIERIDSVDVLLVAIGEEGVGIKTILGWAKKWGVNVIVPIGDDQKQLEKFLDLVDSEGLEAKESYRVEKENLPEGMEVVVLKEI
ncbi:MAG: MBL fold metallo-hydrolase [Candidatus Shapirobacteria bacterium]